MELQTQEIRVSLTKIRPGPFQHRRHFDREKMAELVESIREGGLVNPPIVFQEEDFYSLVAGERRWRASCALMLSTFNGTTLAQALDLVCRADAAQVIAEHKTLKQMTFTVRLVVGADLQQVHLASVIENDQRADLDPIERAQDYQGLKELYGWSNRQVAKKVGKGDAHVSNHLRLLELEPEIQELIKTGDLSKDRRAVDALLAIPDSEARIKLAQRLAQRRVSIKAIEIAAERTAELFRRGPKPEEPRVPVSEATIVRQPAPVVMRVGSSVCFCPACAELVQHLAEELCEGCRESGLTEDCLACDGFIEFAGRLLAYTRPELG